MRYASYRGGTCLITLTSRFTPHVSQFDKLAVPSVVEGRFMS
jgi:hypothetical protein